MDIERCFRIKTRSHKPLVFQCESASVKAAWLEALQDTIDKYASVMKRSIAPDQLQLACMTAEDFEKVRWTCAHTDVQAGRQQTRLMCGVEHSTIRS